MGEHLQSTGKDMGEPEAGRTPRDQRRIQGGRGQEEDISEGVKEKTGHLGRDPTLSKDLRAKVHAKCPRTWGREWRGQAGQD